MQTCSLAHLKVNETPPRVLDTNWNILALVARRARLFTDTDVTQKTSVLTHCFGFLYKKLRLSLTGIHENLL